MWGKEFGPDLKGCCPDRSRFARQNRNELRGKLESQPRRPACEWSRGAASDIDGQAERPNGAFGESDLEGKAAMVAASELGSERVSNERERMNQSFSPCASLQCKHAQRTLRTPAQ